MPVYVHFTKCTNVNRVTVVYQIIKFSRTQWRTQGDGHWGHDTPPFPPWTKKTSKVYFENEIHVKFFQTDRLLNNNNNLSDSKTLSSKAGNF